MTNLIKSLINLAVLTTIGYYITIGLILLIQSFQSDMSVYQQQGDCIRTHTHAGVSRANIDLQVVTKETLGDKGIVTSKVGTCTIK